MEKFTLFACVDACPIHTNVPGYLKLISEGKFEQAYRLIRSTNPLPAVCGRVCYAPCEDSCNRAQLDEPMAIRELKRAATDQVDIESLEVPQIEKTGRKAAIIGSGPAGLAAANDLALEGNEVTIFEALPEAGGLLRYGIPTYRLPKEILRKEIGYIQRLGVEIRTGVRVGKDISLAEIKEKYQAVFIATGAHRGRKLGLEGEEIPGVMDGIKFLRSVNLGEEKKVGEKVAVIGGGNTAIDCARTAKRLGGKDVKIVYRRSRKEMPASKEEVEAVEEEGIEIEFLISPLRFFSENGILSGMECVRMELGEPDSSGRHRPIPVRGTEFTMPIDTVIAALGQAPETEFAGELGISLGRGGEIEIDSRTCATEVSGIFAGGDVVTGPASVIEAIAAGKLAARSINQYLRGEKPVLEEERKPEELSEEELRELKERLPTQGRIRAKERPVEERVKDFGEVSLGLSPQEAIREAFRCLAEKIVPQLVPKEENFAPGHRACIGCGEALAVRLALKALGRKVILVNATGCSEIISSPLPQTSWQVPWIHTLFENVGAVTSGIEAARKVLMRKGKISPEHVYCVGMAGDGGTSDIGIQALSGAMERGQDFLYICYDNEAYMNCLPSSSLIMTENGLKRIVEVKEGDKVYAFDQKSHRLTLKKCTGVFNNGVREVFELKTLHHQIEATPNHPFLVLQRNGRGKENKLIWKTLSEIKPGDMIVVLKDLGRGESHKFNSIKESVVGDYKVTHLNEVNLPEQTTPELMKYLGIYLGDGWTRVEKGEVGFASPESSKERKTLIKLHSKIFGSKIRNDGMYVYINSVNLAKFLENLGFGSGARNKTIPGWIFTLPKEEKEAFIEGLLLSDGYKTGNSLRCVSFSKELLRRLRLLLQTMGCRVGKIHWQRKKKGLRCVNRELLKDAEWGYVCFSKRKKWNTRKNKHFEMEEVKEVKPVSKKPTYDLRVEDEHNFIADGIVVHNTGVQRSSATPYGASTTTAPAGKVSIGQVTWKKNMPEIAAAHNIPYVATACPSYPFDLMRKVRKGAEIKGPAYIHIFSPCPIGWRFPTDLTVKIGKLAVETGIFPLYEMENGEYKLSFDFPQLRAVRDYLKLQRRFRHLTDEEIERIQQRVRQEYEKLRAKCKAE